MTLLCSAPYRQTRVVVGELPMSATDSRPMAVDDLPSSLASRRHQMFPALSEAEIARIRRFGRLRRYAAGERLFAAGEPSPGMFVVLSGKTVISQRDGLGHVAPITSQGAGQFIAEVATLSGRHTLVDA